MLSPNSVGIGLRFQHFDRIINTRPKTPWFEVMVDDFLSSGPHHEKLVQLCDQYRIAMHSVGLNLGGTQDFHKPTLDQFRKIYDTFKPLWISDHLCWSSHNGNFHHDLLPIPRTKDALEHVCKRINYLQDFFSRPLCIENITSYLDFKHEDFDEVEFLNRIVEKTACFLLLDISNVLINHTNRKKDPDKYFEGIPLDAVKQVHLSGGAWDGDTLIDSHSEIVDSEDIKYLSQLIKKGLQAPILIERDANLPDFATLENERLSIAEAIS